MAKRIIVDAAALNLIINALRRDADEGFVARGEMADIILKTAEEYPERQYQSDPNANPCKEIPFPGDQYITKMINDVDDFIDSVEQAGCVPSYEHIFNHFENRRGWERSKIARILDAHFKHRLAD